MTTAFRYVGTDRFHGVPQRDISADEFAAFSGHRKRVVLDSPSYEAVEVRDPLGELTNDEFEALSPAEKGARTRKANELREEAERIAKEQQAAGQANEEAGPDAGEES